LMNKVRLATEMPMKPIPRILAAVVVPVLACSCGSPDLHTGPVVAPLNGPVTGDYKKLQGNWTVSYCERDGLALPDRNGSVFHFQHNRHWIGGDRGDEWYALDDKAVPKSIDFYDRKHPTIRGIYRIEGGQLVLCTADPGLPRPTEFSTSPGSGRILTKVRR
jgi:uncharacterized protein (TIGR03067 family)